MITNYYSKKIQKNIIQYQIKNLRSLKNLRKANLDFIYQEK